MSQKKLNFAQQQAVEYNDGSLLIVAGAGTGKTTMVTEKIAYLLNQKLAKPEEILALTFTDNAATEMQERVDETLNASYTDLQISTFHNFCQRILEQNGLAVGLSNQFKLATETEAWLLMRQHIYDFVLDYYRPMANPSKHIHEFIRHFSKCKDELVSPEDYLQYAENLFLDKDSEQQNIIKSKIQSAGWRTNFSRSEWDPDSPSGQSNSNPPAGGQNSNDGDRQMEIKRLNEIAQAYHKYNQLLLDNNVLDFGDLIFYTVKLFETRPNVLKIYQNQYKYILVDEFQDVNWAQYYLVKLLAQNSQLTVVGDDDQSIYAFRGASVSNIMRFKDDFPQAKEIVLNENYRSDQEILDVAYKSIQNNNPDRLEVKLGIDKRLKSDLRHELRSSPAGDGVEFFGAENLDEEVNFVIEKIREISEQKSVVWDDFAILVRANSHAEPFLNALEKAGIPYEFLASAGLYRQPIVLDVFSFFKAITDYHESMAIFRLLKLPFLSFAENDLQKLTFFAKRESISYYQTLKKAGLAKLSVAGVNKCEQIITWLHAGMKDGRDQKPTTVLYNFLAASGYLAYLTHEETVGNRRAIQSIYHLKQFFDFVSRYEETVSDANVHNFVDYFTSVLNSGDEGKFFQPNDTPDSVNVMTTHSAKGLEFKYVFVVNLVEERFPTRRRGEAIEIPLALIKEQLPEGDSHYQEERRLFYVALTRAKEKLFLTAAEDYGGVRKKKVSRFVSELELESSKSKVQSHPPTSVRLTDYGGQGRQNEDEKSEFIYEIPKVFSFSQIKSYQTCPYQYKLAHILKIKTRGNASFSFGQSMHNTLHKFYQRMCELNSAEQVSLFSVAPVQENIIQSGVKVPTLAELLAMYENSWISEWYQNERQRLDYYHKGKEVLKVFYSAQANNWVVPVALESWFKIKVGDNFIHGRIDRVDKMNDGQLEIIDYKTGTAKEKLSADDKDQLLLYQIAAQSLPEYKNLGTVAKLTFHYLNDNIQSSFLGSEKETGRLIDNVTQTIAEIKQRQFTATPSDFVCGHCDFKDICEFKKG